ncbi:MAG TPA: penicillin-binding protein 2 [Thermoleophilaceae bacterium]|nr:penicillin-binding protein 2 [Thermoleophilaceae bacterium]
MTRLVERRIGLLFAVFLLLLALAAGRAGWLGTVRADDLGGRAADQQASDLEVAARRGTVTDRHGLELAVSEDAVTVFAHPFLIERPDLVARQLAGPLGRSAKALARKLSDRERGFVYLGRKLDPEVGRAVENLEIEGIETVAEPRRRYPQRELAAQLLGTVGTDNYGLSGLERSHEQTLHGVNGRRRLVKDALGKPISIVDQRRAVPGDDLRLTLDAPIQERTEAVLAEVGERYSARGATALVLDPRTGELLAMANWPSADANRAGAALAPAHRNRAVAASYEPGSTFKAVTMSGALEDDLVEPETPFSLAPTIRVADRVIKESHPRGPVVLSAAEILAQSSNVGSVTIGLKLGARRFDHWVRRFGYGRPTGVGLPGEGAGIVPSPSDYSGSSMGNLPIGQGLAATPIQMAAAYAGIANGGVVHRPHVVAGAPDSARRVVSERTARRVSRMLEGVLGPGGTAEEAQVPGYRLAGKTGTAQKPDGLGGYSKTKFVASFIGYAPARSPRLLVAVAVDEPHGEIYGGAVAAPAFEKIVSFALPYLRIPPD